MIDLDAEWQRPTNDDGMLDIWSPPNVAFANQKSEVPPAQNLTKLPQDAPDEKPLVAVQAKSNAVLINYTAGSNQKVLLLNDMYLQQVGSVLILTDESDFGDNYLLVENKTLLANETVLLLGEAISKVDIHGQQVSLTLLNQGKNVPLEIHQKQPGVPKYVVHGYSKTGAIIRPNIAVIHQNTEDKNFTLVPSPTARVFKLAGGHCLPLMPQSLVIHSTGNEHYININII